MDIRFIAFLLSAVVSLTSCGVEVDNASKETGATPIPTSEVVVAQETESPAITETTVGSPTVSLAVSDVPAFSGLPHVEINNNVPGFADAEFTTDAFEIYSELDAVGRCGVAFANICTEIMPTEKRQGIGQVKPAGWHTARYDVVGEGSSGYLYNRCHLIAFELAGENANERNLITGTRYMNIQGMLSFENRTADYVRATGNHVLYRVTPIYEGNNLLVDGVQIEAKSVEDNGEGICFNVFCYNVQPGVVIDYATGESWLDETYGLQQSDTSYEKSETNSAAETTTYILNTNTKKFHKPTCSSVTQMKEKNKREFTGSRDEAINQGYVPCKQCNP